MPTKAVLIQHLYRIQKALDKIPAGQDGLGAATRSTWGLLNFQNDVKDFRARFRNYLYALEDNDPQEMEKWLVAMEDIADKH